MEQAAGLKEVVTEELDGLFRCVDQCALPGAAVGIALNGRTIYRKAFGLASIELPLALTTTTRMRIGSTTKHFTALAFMLLCEEGRAGVDDPVRRHLPELHESVGSVTMRQLMGHVSGLRDNYDVMLSFSGTGRPATTEAILGDYRRISDVNSQPLETWNYNNGGYVMLSVVIERLTGKSLEDVLRERIFEPLGMYDTMLRRLDRDFVANSATLHMVNSAGKFTRDYMGMDIAGEGGIVSTVNDMLRWLAHMDRPWVGSAETWALMRTPQRLLSGHSTGYGLGLMVGDYRGHPIVHHAGGAMGGNCQMIKLTEDKLDIVVMSNRADVNSMLIANDIIDAFIGKPDKKSSAAADPFRPGVYFSKGSATLIRLSKPADQWTMSLDGLDLPAEVVAGHELRPSIEGFQWYVRPGGVDPDGVTFVNFGAADELSPVEVDETLDVTPLVGRYRSPTVEVVAEISAEGGGTLVTTGRYGEARFTLRSIAEGLWRASSLGALPSQGGTLEFIPGGSGFRFTTMRTRRVPFERVS